LGVLTGGGTPNIKGQVHLIVIDNVGRAVFLIGHSSGNFRLTVHEIKGISDFSPQL
jgi:hypothetical protein